MDPDSFRQAVLKVRKNRAMQLAMQNITNAFGIGAGGPMTMSGGYGGSGGGYSAQSRNNVPEEDRQAWERWRQSPKGQSMMNYMRKHRRFSD